MLDLKREDGVGVGSYVLRDTQLVKLSWMVPLCSILASVGVHVALGNARDVPLFISEADYPGLERFVFTTGLLTSSVFHLLLTTRLYAVFKEKARRKTLLTATILGITSSRISQSYHLPTCTTIFAPRLHLLGRLWRFYLGYSCPLLSIASKQDR